MDGFYCIFSTLFISCVALIVSRWITSHLIEVIKKNFEYILGAAIFLCNYTFAHRKIRLCGTVCDLSVSESVWFNVNVNVYRSENCTVAHLTIESTFHNIPCGTLIQLHLKVAECVVERHVDKDFVVNTIYDLCMHMNAVANIKRWIFRSHTRTHTETVCLVVCTIRSVSHEINFCTYVTIISLQFKSDFLFYFFLHSRNLLILIFT